MLSEYEAWVITQCRMNTGDPSYRSRRVAGPVAAIGLILVGILVFSAYERPRATGAGPSGGFKMSAETQPAISENNSAAP